MVQVGDSASAEGLPLQYVTKHGSHHGAERGGEQSAFKKVATQVPSAAIQGFLL